MSLHKVSSLPPAPDLQKLKEFYRHEPVDVSILAVSLPGRNSALTDGCDWLILRIVDEQERGLEYYAERVEHLYLENWKIQERLLHRREVDELVLTGHNRDIMHWLLRGDVIQDSEDYLQGLKGMLFSSSEESRDVRLLREYSALLHRYLQANEDHAAGNVMDAYHNVLRTLVHWARVSIIEEGHHPEVMVWQQVKQINPGIYKLYEELLRSHEMVEKRVGLVLLACEFSIMAKMQQSCRFLFQIMAARQQPWSVQELREHPELKPLQLNMGLLLNKLKKRALLVEVLDKADDRGAKKVRYKVNVMS